MNESTIVGADCEPGVSAASAGAAEAPRDLVAGRLSNTGLPSCASDVGLAGSDASNDARRFSSLHHGFDTVDFTLSLEAPELEGLLALVVPMIGTGEQSDSQYSFVVQHLGWITHGYKVVFSCGIDVCLPRLGHEHYGLRVMVHSKACLVADDVQADVLGLLSYLTGCDELELAPRLVLSRGDVCLDLLMLDTEYQKFCRQVANRGNTVVTRARSIESYMDGARYTGVSIGRENIRLRVYDKKLEAETTGDWGTWSRVYGQGSEMAVAEGYVIVRFEYQLRREFLRECCTHGYDQHDGCAGLRTLDDFRAASGDLFAYLTGDWFRLAGAARGKEHERVTRPFWRDVQAQFVAGAWSELAGTLRRQLRRLVGRDLGRLGDMVGGCLATAAAVLGREADVAEPLTLVRVLHWVYRYIGRDEEQWEDRRDRRFRQLPYGRAVPV